MIIFSFDCAVKNLGVVVVSVNDNFAADLHEAYNAAKSFNTLDELYDAMCKINHVLDSRFSLLLADSFDLSNDVFSNLKILQNNLVETYGYPTDVLIEYQMSINDKSRGIQNALHMYYAPLPGDTHAVHIVHPSLKNTIRLAKNLSLDNFASTSNYRSNKKHSVANYIEYCKIFGHTVNKKKRDDIADALLQAIAWFSIAKDSTAIKSQNLL